jgi:hypothetical protein
VSLFLAQFDQSLQHTADRRNVSATAPRITVWPVSSVISGASTGSQGRRPRREMMSDSASRARRGADLAPPANAANTNEILRGSNEISERQVRVAFIGLVLRLCGEDTANKSFSF